MASIAAGWACLSQPGAVPRELLEDEGLTSESEDPRQRLRDGVEVTSRDADVSDATLRCIAAARSLLLWLIMASAALALLPLQRVTFEEHTRHGTPVEVDFCGEGPRLTGPASNRDSGCLSELGETQVKMFTFAPAGAAASELKLPSVIYTESEEYLAGGRDHTRGLSLGTFARSEVIVHVHVSDTGAQRRCLEHLSALERLREGSAPQDLLGQAIARALADAGRRAPDDIRLTSPRSFGALLLLKDERQVWCPSDGKFLQPYVPSAAWSLYRMAMAGLQVLTTTAACFVLVKLYLKLWSDAMQVWIVQYDYLWEHVAQQVSGEARALCRAADGEAGGGEAPSAARELAQLSSTFEHQYQACSFFFVLDHIVGNPQGNSERWLQGLASASIHGLCSLLWCVLPVVHSCFFPDWKPLSSWLVASFAISSAAFGTSYYFAMPWGQRRPLFFLYLAAFLACKVYSVAYLCCILLFMATRLVVAPEIALGYFTTLATGIAFVVVGAYRLMALRDEVKARLEGKESKGYTIRFLRFLGLDIRAMVAWLATGFVLILLSSGMLMLVAMLYFTNTPSPQHLLANVCTPFATLYAAYKALKDKEDGFKTAMDANAKPFMDML